MIKIAIRLLVVASFVMPLVSVSVASPVEAATNSTKAKKHTRKVQTAPAVQSAKSHNPFPPMSEDPDRMRASGGGGGY